MRVERYNSVESYSRLVETAKDYQDMCPDLSWYGGISFNESLDKARVGDTSVVSDYQRKVDNLIDAMQNASEPRKIYENSVCGTRVSVPDYLGGNPFNMKRKVVREIENRSVHIYVSTTCSAAISAEKMIARGATILALIEYLQMCRYAVQLSLLSETHGRTTGDLIQVISVETPLNLSTAGFAIAHPAFARHLTYSYARKIDGFNGCWGASHYRDDYKQLLSKALNMNIGDVYIPPPVYNDEEIMSKPDIWLKNKISQIKSDLK